MKVLFLLPAFIFFAVANLSGQHYTNQNKIWTFGTRAGVDFTTGSPVPFTSSISTSEGCAAVGNSSTGNLLFYTDGQKVWNNTHAIMPTGSAIATFGTSSSTQGALIVPVIGDPNKYYIFSLENVFGSTGYCHLVYCIVDMTLDGGLGDVISTTISTPMTDVLGEKLTAISGDNCNIWVITHRKDSTTFLAYEINSAGVSTTPVSSVVGTFTGGSYGYAIGVMKGSPDRHKIATVCYNPGSATGNGAELYDFNPTTGVVSNCRVLDSVDVSYGAEFSPDGTKLYVDQGSADIVQYDVSLATAAAMRASAFTVATGSGYPQMKLGPDGKIYTIGISGTGFLDAINFPNLAGSACGFTAHAVNLSPNSGIFGLPNIVVTVAGGDTTFVSHDTTVCIPIAGNITIRAHDTGSGYLWDDGTTSTITRTISAFGNYWVTISNGCTIIVDTIHVHQIPLDTVLYHHDTTVCQFITSIDLHGPTGYTSFQWNNGTTGSTRTVTDSGTYWVRVHDTCGNARVDTIHVHYQKPDTTRQWVLDTVLCVSYAPITLHGPAGYTLYQWSNGSTTSTITAGTATAPIDTLHYSVSARLGCHVRIDSFRVTNMPVPTVNLGNDTAFCIGYSIVLNSPQPFPSTYLWNTGSTAASITASTSGTYWLYVNNGWCDNTDSIHVTVSPYPVVDLGPDLFNCEGIPYTLKSSGTYTAPYYVWSDFTTYDSINVALSGTYWLQVTDVGCTNADSINVTIYYDTFTLKNVDTAICMGQTVQTYLTANPSATFQWVPSAGIAASTTASPLITPDTSAMYTVNIYLTGCPVKQDSFYVDVQPNPSVYIGGNRFVCEFDTLHIHAFVHPAWYNHYSYSWSPATGLDDPAASVTVLTASDSTHIKVIVTTPAGCKGGDSAFVMVHPGNFATIGPDTALCPHDSLQLLPAGGLTYSWHPGIYLSDSTSAMPWIHPVTSQYYTLIAASQYGCLDTLGINITVHPGASIYLGDSVTLYPGESYQISPQTNCNIFAWFPPSGLDNAYISNPLATPMISTKYIVTAMNEFGCKATDSLSIYLSDESVLAVPNAFSPGNGPNNLFKISKRGLANLKYFRIYNRWGNKVFEAQNIDQGWDGSYNGKPQPTGVFVYEIEAVTSTGNEFHKKGNVTLLR